MATDTEQVYMPQTVRILGASAGVRRFLWHFVQMVLAMMVGMGVYHLLLRTVLAETGYAALTKAYPLFGYWMMVVSMPFGMIALMRYYHKSSWRYCGEMTIAMIAPLAVLTVLVLCYLLPIQSLYGIGDPAMILAMAAFMLVRPGAHTHGAHEHSGHEHTGTPQAEMTKHTADEQHEVHLREMTMGRT